MIYEFLPRQSIIDDRAKFANAICDLIAKNSPYSIYGSMEQIKTIYEYFEKHVRNIYELIDSQIPLFAYYNLRQVDEDNYGWTKEQYLQNLEISKKAASNYHNWE